MEWRNARVGDLAAVIPWLRDTRQCLLWAGGNVHFPLHASRLADEIEFTPETAWCLCENGELVGFGQILQRAPSRAHFARLIVLPALRGHGYGTALCKNMLETVKRWPGYEIATLNVFRGNLVAQALYTRMGFYPVDLAASDQRDPNTLLMVRALTAHHQPGEHRTIDAKIDGRPRRG